MRGTNNHNITALLKDIRRLYAEQLPLETRASYGPNVIRILIQGMIHILEALPKLEITLPETLKNHAVSIIESERQYPPMLSSNIAYNLTRLISSPAIKEALSRQSEFHLEDCWSYLAQQLLETPGWGREAWIPSVEDFNRVRMCTSGILEDTFTIDDAFFKFIDVNKQRGDKRKWIHLFINAVHAVLFITNLSEYDQRADEDRNRFEEALSSFSEICNNPVFKGRRVLLYMDQVEQFQQKFMEHKMPSTISDGLYSYEKNDPQAAVKWVEKQFTGLAANTRTRFQVVKSEDTRSAWENIRTIFDTIIDCSIYRVYPCG